MASVGVQGYLDDGTTTGAYTETVESLLEYVPDLLWPLSVRTFARMRTDPSLGGVLRAYGLPIRRAQWAVDPKGCRKATAAFCADELGLPVLGAEDKPTGARRRHITWARHLRLALLILPFGHSPFERTYMYDGDKLRLDTLAERMPQTIDQIELNAADGSLKSVSQAALQGSKGPRISADSLVWYALDREGSNWPGRSILRDSYAPWLIKHELWRVLATSSRRFGMGVPSVEAPPGATPQQVAEAARLASSIRVGDQSGAGLPPGYTLRLSGITGSVPDTLAFIRYLDEQMTRNTLTGLLDLGSTATGSRALGETFLDLFMLALQTIADDIADQATTQLLVPLVNANWGEDEPVPQIVCADVKGDREVTAETLKLLLDSGALKADPGLEEDIRRRYKLPERDPDAPVTPPPAAPPAAPQPPAAPTPAQARASTLRQHLAHAASGLRRQPTEIEAKSAADFMTIQQQWQSALDTLVASWGAITTAQRDDLLAQIESAVNADDLSKLGELTVDSTAAAALLEVAMLDAAAAAQTDAIQEGAAQGVTPTGEPKVDAARLSGVAAAMAAITGNGLASFAARSALQTVSTGAKGSAVADSVRVAIDGLTDSSLRDNLGAGLSAAQNGGRASAFGAMPPADYYASEILDAGTCPACQENDGHAYASWDDAQAAYATGGYVNCQGGLRCRGIIVAVWP